MDNNFTFLTVKQINGDNQLDIIKKYGAACSITDFAILLGGFVNDDHYTLEGKSLENRTGCWWTRSTDGLHDVYIVRGTGQITYAHPYRHYIGARPALFLSSSFDRTIISTGVTNQFGIKEIEYGEYPQTIVNENYSRELERTFNFGNVEETGKVYTTNFIKQHNNSSFQPKIYKEYGYNGEKYIRMSKETLSSDLYLSDGRIIRQGQQYWIAVKPIVWLVDEKANIALSKKVLFTGIEFQKRYYQGDFYNTDIKKFMDNYFSKEIVTDKKYFQSKIHSLNKEEDKYITNPYHFNFDKVSEEDIIRGAIESNIPVFIHGKSSEGKSARVKQLDPDCEIVYMRNVTPDSLNGKSVYNALTGEMIDVPPTWYTRILEKCNKEPNKIHLVFFDELTNALPSIQGMAFNIVLDKEVNGKWMLPPNARIVAAGNDLDDSLAANQMAEPLFNRFAHVYIHTTVNNWLKWASTPKDKYERLDYIEEKEENIIHPSIYEYIAYETYSGNDVLRTPYTGEKPNADPRKWEMASKILYKTRKPEMLRALVGEDLTRDFTAFTKQQTTNVENVINHIQKEKIKKLVR